MYAAEIFVLFLNAFPPRHTLDSTVILLIVVHRHGSTVLCHQKYAAKILKVAPPPILAKYVVYTFMYVCSYENIEHEYVKH